MSISNSFEFILYFRFYFQVYLPADSFLSFPMFFSFVVSPLLNQIHGGTQVRIQRFGQHVIIVIARVCAAPFYREVQIQYPLLLTLLLFFVVLFLLECVCTAVEDQCINRIHRIGQTAKRVFVRKFYVADSIEERIMELQRRKKNIASSALSDIDKMDASSSSRPSLDDFKLLFQESCDSAGGGNGNRKSITKS